jgi:hypothetical protein
VADEEFCLLEPSVTNLTFSVWRVLRCC